MGASCVTPPPPSGIGLTSGLDPESQFVYGEDRDEFAALQREYITRFQPPTPEERFYVDTLIRNDWTLRRLFRAEAHLWEHQVIRAPRSEGTPLGAALTAADQVFRNLQRRITLVERSYKDALAELGRLQRSRATPKPAPQPQPDTADTPELAPFLPLSSRAGASAPPPPFRAASPPTQSAPDS